MPQEDPCVPPPHHVGPKPRRSAVPETKSLADRVCLPCRGGVPPLRGDAISRLLAELEDWEVVDGPHLTKEYLLPDFAAALELVNRVGAVAEESGHHPDVHLAWGKVRIDLWTHKIDGLTESDFVVAARCDRLLGR
jgi:4a-hydroxytetrahydrobiopterin dehydratase